MTGREQVRIERRTEKTSREGQSAEEETVLEINQKPCYQKSYLSGG